MGGLEDSEATGEQLQEGRHASGRRRPRKSRRDRDRRRGRRCAALLSPACQCRPKVTRLIDLLPACLLSYRSHIFGLR